MNTATLILNIFIAIGGLAGLSSLFNTLVQRRKTKAETSDIEQNISEKLMNRLDSDNTKVREERDSLRLEVFKAREETENLRIQSEKDVALVKQELRDVLLRMEQYEINQINTRTLIIRLINWSKWAADELSHYKKEDMQQPPIEDLLKNLKITIT